MKKFCKFLSAIDLQGAAIAFSMFVLGVLFTPLPESMLGIACYVAGGVTIVWGLAGIALGIKRGEGRKAYNIILNAVIIITGVLLLLAPDFISDIITILLGVLLIADSILKIQDSFSLYRLKARGWLATAIAGGVCAVLGLIAVFNPFATMRMLMIFVGISMLVDSVLSFAILAISAARDAKDGDGGEGGQGG